jgi:Family of unknown function (DUF6364)
MHHFPPFSRNVPPPHLHHHQGAIATNNLLTCRITSFILYDMQTKLTLRMDSDLIEDAKRIAEERNVSLSQMVSDFLRALTKRELSTRLNNLPPKTASLYGALKAGPIIDEVKSYREFLDEKYS